MRYCPDCGAEYRLPTEECSDCQVALVDQPPAPPQRAEPIARERTVVFRSGRRMEAELVRGRLEADGMDAQIWSSGLGPWRMEAALTEVTGVPNDFNSHQVVVDPEDEGRARELLAEIPDSQDASEEVSSGDEPTTTMSWLRQRWILVAFAFFLLLVVLFVGLPE